MTKYQLFADLPPATEAALRASIVRFGVLVPVVKDQNGQIIDGHHRSRIAAELHVDYKVDQVEVVDAEHAKAIARTLNADRRHLTEQQRREVVAALAGETVAAGKGGREEVARHSPEAIAGALGVDRKTVVNDINELGNDPMFVRPAKTLGQDGKVRPTRRADPDPAVGPNARKKTHRIQLTKAFDRAAAELVKAVERVDRLTLDDRFAYNAEQVAQMVRHDLLRALELLAKAVDRVPNTQKESTE